VRLCVKIERLTFERTERKKERKRQRHLSFELDADKFVINYGTGKLDLSSEPRRVDSIREISIGQLAEGIADAWK